MAWNVPHSLSIVEYCDLVFFFSSRRRHTRFDCDWSSDVCSSDLATLQGFHGRNVERTFSGYKLRCVFIERDSGISDPTQYCFEPDSSVLRYTRGFGWFQTVYNRIEPFQGRNIAQEVDVTDGGKPYLKLRLEAIEFLSHVDDASF